MTEEDWAGARKLAATQAPPTYSSAEVCQLASITYAQLDRWCHWGHLRPQWRNRDGKPMTHGGSGIDRRFTQDELDRARMMARLVALGVTAQQAAKLARDQDERHNWLRDMFVACRAMEP